MKPVLLCSHSSQCFNKIISRNTLDKLRMDYHRIKVRKQSSKCSHSSQCFNKIISRNIKVRKQSSKCSLHSQCFRTLIRYIVSIWIPALYLLLYGVIPLRMISWQIIFRKLKSVCLLRAQRFRNIICHNSLGEIADGLSSNQSIKVRKQSSKCSLHSQCFRTLIRYIVSIWIPALYTFP